jgi:regulatory protein
MRKKIWQSSSSTRRGSPDTPESRDLAFNYSLKYLSFRGRSVKEVSEYLADKNFSQDVINSVLKRLLELKFLNDEDFGKLWIESRQKHKGKSKFVLRNELKNKGLSDEVINPLLREAHDDFETAKSLFEKKKKTLRGLTKEDFRKKMSGFLGRRGFSYEIIMKLLKGSEE